MSNANQGVFEVNGDAVVSDEMPTSISVLPMSEKPLDVKEVLEQANTLRDEATKDFQQFYVGGRNATKKSMHKVYGLFYAVMNSGGRESVLSRMKAKLPVKAVKKTTTDAAVFIRYVFADFNDKQVHVYKTALEVALFKSIEPSGFTNWVEGHTGEFNGIRALAAAKHGAPSFEPWEQGMDWARGETKVEATIEANDWDEDEPCRILIAVPNDDGTASVKDTELPVERVKAVLAIFSKDRFERNTPKGKTRKKLSEIEKRARTQLKNDLFYQEQLVTEYRFDLAHATTRGHMIDAEAAEYKLSLANARVNGLKASLKNLGKATAE